MSHRIAPPPAAGVLAAFATLYVVWGSTYLAIRFAVETLPPFTMAGARFVVAGAVLYGWSRARGAAPLTRPEWRTAAIVGALLVVGGNGLVSWAEQTVPSGIAALLVASEPLWIVLLDGARRGGERPTAAVWTGVALGFVGIGVLVGPGAVGGAPVDPSGALAVGTAAFCWALGSVVQRGVSTAGATLLHAGGQMLVGGALLLAVGVGVGERVDVSAVSARSAWAFAYLVVAGSLVAYSVYVWLLAVTTPTRASTYAYVNPVVAVLLGWALAGEPLGPRVAGAGALVVAAVVFITSGDRGAGRTPAAEVGRPAAPLARRRAGGGRRS